MSQYSDEQVKDIADATYNRGYLSGLRKAVEVCMKEELRLRALYAKSRDDDRLIGQDMRATAARCALEIEDEIRAMTQREKA